MTMMESGKNKARISESDILPRHRLPIMITLN